MPRLTSVVFRLTRQKLFELKQLSRVTRVRQSEYLREAIEDVLSKHEKSSGVSFVPGGPSAQSEHSIQ
jgi:predicted DNA-binding protein